ncbi:MAG: hypothetical protein ACRC0G_05910 [Fusobacteriaceae bacterium]
MPRTTRIGEYDVIINDRFYKNFNKPLPYSWILQDEPLVVIKKGEELVLVETFKSATMLGEEVNIELLTKDFKHVKEFEVLNNKLKVKKNSYVFDNYGNPVKNNKHRVNLMLDDISKLFPEKIKALHYSPKTFEVLDYESILKRDDIFEITELTYDKSISRSEFFSKELVSRKLILMKNIGFDEKQHDILMEKHNLDIERGEEVVLFKRFYMFKKSFSDEPLSMYFLLSDSKLLELSQEPNRCFKANVSLNISNGEKANALDATIPCEDFDIFSDGNIFNFDLMFEKGIIFLKK